MAKEKREKLLRRKLFRTKTDEISLILNQASSTAVAAAKKFTPLFSRVLVQKYKPTKMTVSGIHLPESAQVKQNIGIVLAVGDKVDVVKVNDHVLLSEYAGTEVKIDGEELHLYRDEDLLGVVKM